MATNDSLWLQFCEILCHSYDDLVPINIWENLTPTKCSCQNCCLLFIPGQLACSHFFQWERRRQQTAVRQTHGGEMELCKQLWPFPPTCAHVILCWYANHDYSRHITEIFIVFFKKIIVHIYNALQMMKWSYRCDLIIAIYNALSQMLAAAYLF